MLVLLLLLHGMVLELKCVVSLRQSHLMLAMQLPVPGYLLSTCGRR
jgi:hypothetical protein